MCSQPAEAEQATGFPAGHYTPAGGQGTVLMAAGKALRLGRVVGLDTQLAALVKGQPHAVVVAAVGVVGCQRCS